MGKAKIEQQSSNRKDKGGIKMVRGNRKVKTVSEGTKTLRQLYNKLMSKDKKAANKIDIINKVLKQIDGNFSEVCFKHDGCRVLQGSLKYGSNDQRKTIINKLMPLLYDIINGKYSIFLSQKIFKYATNEQKNEIMKTVLIPNYRKILKFSGGITFTRYVFLNSHVGYQEQLIDLYFEQYLKIPFEKIKENAEKIANEEDVEMKDANIVVEKGESFETEDIREKIKTHCEKQLEAGVSKNFIFHGFLNKIFDFLDEKTQVYLSELFDDDFGPFLTNTYGFKLVCKLYAVAPAKTRKKVIKKIRESINNEINDENFLYFVIKIILFTDDTKIIEKNFNKLIIEKLTDNLQGNLNILKIIWNLLYPYNKKCNNVMQQEALSFSRPYSNKKDLDRRQAEIFTPMFEDIYKIIYYEIRFLLTDDLFSIFLTDFIQFLIDKDEVQKVEEVINKVISILELDEQSNKDTITNSLLAHRVAHKTIKRIMKSLAETKNESKKYFATFVEKIAKMLKRNMAELINTKAIFIVVQIMENESTKKLLKEEMTKYRKEIMENKDNKKLAGMMLLAKIIE